MSDRKNQGQKQGEYNNLEASAEFGLPSGCLNGQALQAVASGVDI